MNRRLMYEESLKVWWWYVPFLLLLILYCLARIQPLYYNDFYISMLCAVQGALLGYRIFNDPLGTQSFMWSRPITRIRLFCTRWIMGVVFQVFTTLVVLTILAGGLRSWVQGTQEGFYHPMVRWYELNTLWAVILPAWYCFHLTLFFKTYSEFVWNKPRTEIRLLQYGVMIPSIAVIMTYCLYHPQQHFQFMHSFGLTGMVVQVLMATMVMGCASLFCYQKMEVES